MENENQNTAFLSWDVLEKKTDYNRDKIILFMIVGFAASVTAFIFESYIFSLFCLLAPATFIYLGNRDALTLHFKITEEGFFLDDDFIAVEEVNAYNIIDVPGARAHLLLRINRLVPINELIPIYDQSIDEVRRVMKSLEIPEDETIGIGWVEKLNTVI